MSLLKPINRQCKERNDSLYHRIAFVLKNSFAMTSIILLVLSLTLFSCFKYEDVQLIKVANIRLNNISTKKIEIGIDMQIVNPNNYKISIVDSDLELYIKGKKIGMAHVTDKIELPKKSDQIHKIGIETDLKDMLSGAIPVLLSLVLDDSIELQVKGEIKAKAKAISKSFPVDFTERVKLNK